MDAFAKSLFASLRAMDAEACTFRDGVPTGLSWYAAWSRPELKRPQTEPAWTRRLEELLTKHGYPTQSEVAYPGNSRLWCDNVVTLKDGGVLWLENKGSWKEYWIECGREWIYRSYLLHPLVPDLDPKSHSVALDLEKLGPLRRPDATWVGILLVGFDSVARPMDDDIDELTRLAHLNDAPWQLRQDSWADVYRPTCRVNCWFWFREVD